MKIEIEVEAEHIDWKELTAKILEAVSEEATDVSSAKISYTESCEEE